VDSVYDRKWFETPVAKLKKEVSFRQDCP
jgi:hypothetical protein